MYIYNVAFQKLDMGYACTISLLFVAAIMVVTIIQFIVSKKWVNYD